MNAASFSEKLGNARTCECEFQYQLSSGPYRVRFATSDADRKNVFRLRFTVFNLELNEGLDSSYRTGYDSDEFDLYCDHLMVEERSSGQTVGTYRLQRAATARASRGFYSEREFDFAPYEVLADSLMELGRACIRDDHRSTQVLNLLWHGILHYSLYFEIRYLIGCCSLSSQDPACGTAVYNSLLDHQVPMALRTIPLPPFQMPLVHTDSAVPDIPKLLRTYLALGAKICGQPAIDRDFKTIDFLTLLDLDMLHPRIRARLMKA